MRIIRTSGIKAKMALLLVASGLTFAACGDKPNNDVARSVNQEPAPQTVAAQTEAVEPVEEPVEEPETVSPDAVAADAVAADVWTSPKLEDSAGARKVASSEAEAETLVIAGFENDMDGFGGAIERDPSSGKSSAASAKIINGGENWVTTGKDLGTLRQDFLEVRFWIKSKEASGITVRLVDGSNQTHQQRPSFKPNGEWQQIIVSDFDGGPGYQAWGGADDKKWHAPAKHIGFILEKGTMPSGKGSVWVDQVEAVMNPDPIIPKLAIETSMLGNVFLSTDDVALQVLTKGDRVKWKITDFNRETLAEGDGEVNGGKATLRPPKKNGYFLVNARAYAGDEQIAEYYTSYSVMSPLDLPARARAFFGVMTHFSQGMSTDILPLMAQAGITSIRDEHYWARVESKKGQYEFDGTSDAYMKACTQNEIDPLVAMTFGNKLYDGGHAPATQTGREAYARYGQEILKHYGKQVKWLEVWNEYNGSWCGGEAETDRPRYYAEMIKVAYRRIKELRPDVKVLGCACVLIPLPYIEGIFKHGGLDAMDAIVIHPYRGRPEGVEEEVAELEELIRKYNDGKDKPIWVTETGSMDDSEYDFEKGKSMWERGRSNAARYLARQYVLLMTRNVEKTYWYLCRDHMEFKTMGLLRNVDDVMGRYAVAPPYVAYATLIRQLGGTTYAQREAVRQYTRARVYLFKRGADEVRACWATKPSRIELATSRPLVLVDLMGVEKTVKPAGGKVVLDLGEDIVYVKGAVKNVKEIVTGPQVIASNGEDYTKVQGGNNWYYGYYDGDGQGSGDGKAPKGGYTDDDFETMKQIQTIWGYTWAGPALYMKLGRDNGHPEIIDGKAGWSVLRWKSPIKAKVRLTGSFSLGEQGDGVGGVVLIDGKRVFEKIAGGAGNPGRVAFDVPVSIDVGTNVDFAVTPGPGLNIHFDSTTIEAIVSTAAAE